MIRIVFNTLVLLLFFQGISQEEGTFHTKNGITYYQCFGKGLPILIINGGPGMNSEGFISLAKELAKNNKTIIYDQRGTGKSVLQTINARTITIDLMVEDIEALRNHLHIDKWIVMGHSFGGMLAYAYAAKYPESITAMIQSSSGGMNLDLTSSININGRLTRTERDSLSYYNNKITQGDTSYKTSLKRGTFLAPAYVYNKKNIPIIAERLTQGNNRINSLVWSDLYAIHFDTSAGMKKFTKPTLIIHGADDVVDAKIAINANEILPNSTLFILKDCGHYGWLDQEKLYYSKIENFLQNL